MDDNRIAIAVLVLVLMAGQLWAKSVTRLEYSCRQGIIGVQAHLKLNNEAEYMKMAKLCEAYSSNDTILLQNNELKEGTYKRSWECGLGIGIALRYYKRSDLIKDTDWMSNCSYI